MEGRTRKEREDRGSEGRTGEWKGEQGIGREDEEKEARTEDRKGGRGKEGGAKRITQGRG